MTATVHAADVVLTMADGELAEPLRDGAVLVEGDRVVAVGPRADVERQAGGARMRRWPGILTPGLVNAHAHLEYGPPFAHLAAAGLPFPEWMLSLSRIRADLTDTDWQVSARGSGHLLLKSGTTAVADVVTRGPAIGVATSLGLQGISYGELAGVDDTGWPAALARLDGLLGTPGRSKGVSPHTLYTLGTQVFRDLTALARSRGMRLHPHLAETSDEAEWVLSGSGAFGLFVERFGFAFELAGVGAGVGPVRHCDDLGGLGPDVHVAHGVHADADDRALLRDARDAGGAVHAVQRGARSRGGARGGLPRRGAGGAGNGLARQ